MPSTILKISRLGKSRGIRLPAKMLRKYQMVDSIIAEERSDEIVLRAPGKSSPKLSWAATAKKMAAAKEDWSEWDSISHDGLNGT